MCMKAKLELRQLYNESDEGSGPSTLHARGFAARRAGTWHCIVAIMEFDDEAMRRGSENPIVLLDGEQ